MFVHDQANNLVLRKLFCNLQPYKVHRAVNRHTADDDQEDREETKKGSNNGRRVGRGIHRCDSFQLLKSSAHIVGKH